jgi:Asp-tRNA(Asn)/Glu-tRNA(Gln) amidotransferase C subunit
VADLTEAEVRALAQVLQLSLTAEDAAEVTHRLNAFLDALAPLVELEADGVDATPAPIDPDRA